MKKIILKSFTVLFGVVLFQACDSNNVIEQVTGSVKSGAVLRTVAVLSNTLNSSIPTTSWGVTVEEQDDQNGALLKSVGVYVTFKDLTPDNGTTVASDKLVKTIAGSAFTAGPFGLPRATISATFAEAVSAMGVTPSQYAPGDLFVFELRLELTDGRIFTSADVNGTVSGGSFFKSPFKYNALIVCSPEPGVYTIKMHDSYGDGWQTTTGGGGRGIKVVMDSGTIEFGMCSPYEASPFVCTPNDGFDAETTVTIPAGTLSANWIFPGDQYGEIGFEIFGPANQLLLAVPFGTGAAGILPVTLCAM